MILKQMVKMSVSKQFVISVHLLDGRFRGEPEWPPAPARLFQALVAGAARGAQLSSRAIAALQWLEALPAPIIIAPRFSDGQAVLRYVPNNDADSPRVRGDPSRTSEIRTAKRERPRLLVESDAPIRYIWTLKDDDEEGRELSNLVQVVDDLYQFGRGVDQAWARMEVLDNEATNHLLSESSGTIHRPGDGTDPGKVELACAFPGTLASLQLRHTASLTRIAPRQGQRRGLLFRQAPKPQTIPVTYSGGAHRLAFDLRTLDGLARSRWPLGKVAQLVTMLRDAAVARLTGSLPHQAEVISASLVGARPGQVRILEAEARIRIIPLPSVGTVHTDPAIRRVLVEVPASCPLPVADVVWAFEGLQPVDADSGEMGDCILVPTRYSGMAGFYGIEQSAGVLWQTVTPVAVPESAARRRIDPARRQSEAKGSLERTSEEAAAKVAIFQALRHAKVDGKVESIEVRREPFLKRGIRAEEFAAASRFPKERLWHASITFARPMNGPMVIGDGRFQGLGLLCSVEMFDGRARRGDTGESD